MEAENPRIQRMVASLLDNAINYTPKGGRITVEVTRVGGGVVGRVRRLVFDTANLRGSKQTLVRDVWGQGDVFR